MAAVADRPDPTAAADTAVAADRLTKLFANRRVLSDVTLAVRRGEIHALLGANGSGKSTLVKLLTGVYRPDDGAVVVGDRRVRAIASPAEANALGIAVVHQEAPLIDSLSVAECIAQFRGYPTRGGRILWRRLERETAQMLERFGVAVRAGERAGRLTAAERALVAIVIALDRVRSGLRLLILDEVTASLPRNQAEPYLDRVAALARSGVGVLMVTHRLAELHGRADHVTLLRDGRVAYSAAASEADDRRLVAEMIAGPGDAVAGNEARGTLRRLWTARGTAAARPAASHPALAMEQVVAGNLHGISFDVQMGEVVGVAGLAESGVAELPRLLAGLMQPASGSIRVAGRVVPRTAGPRATIAAGIAVLPADRLHAGGIPSLPMADNVVLPDLRRYWLARMREHSVLARLIADFDIRPPLPATLFGKLSGGNQQKAILGKWLLLQPAVLVLDDPTSGVDPGARQKIFELLRDAAAEGLGILMFSTEPEQFASVCARVLVLRNGRIATELTGAELTPEAIARWCYA